MHDPRIIAVVRQQFIAVIEKTIRRNTVILEDDRFFCLPKDPVQARGDTMAATHVGLGEIRQHLAVPIHLIRQCARRGAFRFILRVPRSVSNHEHALWAGAANRLEDARRQPWPVKYK